MKVGAKVPDMGAVERTVECVSFGARRAMASRALKCEKDWLRLWPGGLELGDGEKAMDLGRLAAASAGGDDDGESGANALRRPEGAGSAISGMTIYPRRDCRETDSSSRKNDRHA